MKLALVMSLVIAFAAGAAEVKAPPKVEGVTAVEDAWVAAMKANDIQAIVQCYAKDATLWMPGQRRIDGALIIRAAYEGWLGGNTVQDVVLSNRKSETSGNLSTGWGEFDITMVSKAGGDPVHHKGRYVEVAVKRNGRWVYLVDHASDDPPPAAP